jgi:hypothetical protein
MDGTHFPGRGGLITLRLVITVSAMHPPSRLASWSHSTRSKSVVGSAN